MNKGITLIILGVLLSAMGMVFYSHLGSEPTTGTLVAETAATNSPASMPETGPLTAAEVPVTTPGGQAATPPAAQNTAQPSAQTTPPVQTPPVQAPPAQPQTPVETVPPPADRPQEQATETPSAQPSSLPALQPLDTPPPTPEETAQTSPPEPSNAPNTTVDGAAPALTPLASLPKNGKHTMKALGLHFSGNSIYLRIEAGTAFPFKTFSLSGPDRLVVDLPGTWTGISAPSIPGNNLVTGARVGNQPAGPRLVLDLSRKVKTKVERISDTIVEITLE